MGSFKQDYIIMSFLKNKMLLMQILVLVSIISFVGVKAKLAELENEKLVIINDNNVEKIDSLSTEVDSVVRINTTLKTKVESVVKVNSEAEDKLKIVNLELSNIRAISNKYQARIQSIRDRTSNIALKRPESLARLINQKNKQLFEEAALITKVQEI